MGEPTSSGDGRGRGRTKRRRLFVILQVLLAVAVVVGVFVGVIPKLASYASVWRTISRLTGTRLAVLAGVTALNVFTYWPQMVAAMPGLTLAQAAVNNQSSTAIANVVPGGGAIAVGVSYAEFRSWGFSNSDIALLTLVTGVWNAFVKFGMPMVALAILALEGHVGRGLLAASLIGLAALTVSLVLLALALWQERFAEAIGSGLGKAASLIRRLIRKPPVQGWGKAAVKFRSRSLELARRRWIALTVTTVVSHVSLFLVLLICLRDVGVGSSSVTWAEALGVFAFARLVAALPITPGGVGVIELSYIGGLVLAGADRAPAVAAVLLFRALTYFLQIPLGPVAYLIWQRKESWRRSEGARHRTAGSGSRPRSRSGRARAGTSAR